MEIFVGCGSSKFVDPKYLDIATELGKLIGENGHSLIFGSSELGMMGKVYHATKKSGGKIIAIIPKNHRGLLTEVNADKIIEAEDLSDHLKKLTHSGDITIIMPGGFGTLAELITSIYCKKIGQHNKPIFILNSFGFFDNFFEIVDNLYNKNFDNYDCDKLYKVVTKPKEIFDYIKNNL